MAIKQRNVVTTVLLSIVTCGIYGIYWAYCMAKEAVSVKDPEDSALLEIILTIIFPCAGLYLVEKKFAEGCAAKGIEHKDNAILYLILGLVLPIAGYIMLQLELNKLATE